MTCPSIRKLFTLASRQRLLVFAVSGALLGVIAAGAADAVQPGKTHEAFVGSFRYAGDPGERKAVREAIDTIVDQMNFFFRPFAREYLRRRNRIPAYIEIRFTDDDIAIGSEGGTTYVAPRDGREVAQTSPGGEAVNVSHSIRSNRLVQNVISNDGCRRRIFRLEANPPRLRVSITLMSSHLPAPLAYELTYVR